MVQDISRKGELGHPFGQLIIWTFLGDTLRVCVYVKEVAFTISYGAQTRAKVLGGNIAMFLFFRIILVRTDMIIPSRCNLTIHLNHTRSYGGLTCTSIVLFQCFLFTQHRSTIMAIIVWHWAPLSTQHVVEPWPPSFRVPFLIPFPFLSAASCRGPLKSRSQPPLPKKEV